MTVQDFANLLPLLILAGASVIMLLVISIWRNHRLTYVLTLLSLAAAFVAFLNPISMDGQTVGILLVFDSFTWFYSALLTGAAMVVTVFSFRFLEELPEQKEEYYILILLVVLGGGILVSAIHFASLFLGLELLSVGLYALVGYLVKSRARSLEAGAKYLVLAAASAAFLLFGMAMIYYETGAMEFAAIGEAVRGADSPSYFLICGFGFMVVAFGFKLALVPFHMWTPDVYEGAPAPVSALVATVSKGAVVGILLRFWVVVDGYQFPGLLLLFTIFAVASMIGGNILALMQKNVKRILAYSSIAHLGYFVVAFLSGGEMASESATFYLLAYFITILGAFGMVTYLTHGEKEAQMVEDYQGLFWRRPGPALVFTAMLLSLAGIPLTAGFIGKFYIVAAGVEAELWLLLFTLVISSVIGLFYYLRIVVSMFSQAPEEAEPSTAPGFSSVGLVLGLLLVALVWLGVFPQGVLEMIGNWVG